MSRFDSRFDGTAARQLELVDDYNRPIATRPARELPATSMRLLRKDIYVELARRRRRAQIDARHELDRS